MNSTSSAYRKYLRWFWVIFALPFVSIILIFVLISTGAMGEMPSFEQLENPQNDLAAEVYAEDGLLLGKFYFQNRTWTSYDEISPAMIDALVATEDIRFYRHSGIDFRGLGRVFVKTVLLGQSESGGGSTITQQLAKNLFPRDTATHRNRISRTLKLVQTKFKEWHTAVRLERSYTKEEIMTMYLNVFDFLYQAVGVKSAAQVYFNTTPDSLKTEQAATLVGMAKNPSYFNPLRRLEETRGRRNVVLSQMVKYGYLEAELADSLKQLPLELDFKESSHNVGLATHFREYLRTTMNSSEPRPENFWGGADDPNYQEAKWQWENNPLYGWCKKNLKPNGEEYNLYTDGLRIYTTINSKMQQYAEEAIREHLAEDLQPAFNSNTRFLKNAPISADLEDDLAMELIEGWMRNTDRYRRLRNQGVSDDSIRISFNTPTEMRVFTYQGEADTLLTPMDSILYYKHFLRTGMMSMDPHTGHVKAYAGGPDFKYFKYDPITQQRRQPGSTIKPFLYTLAMQDGFSPCHLVPNIPQKFADGDSVWIPKSTGPIDMHGKMVTLKWGLAQSENYVSAWVMKRFNPQAVINVMRKMGIRSPIAPYNTIFLGVSDLSVYEMVGAYGTFANKGIYTEPIFVTRIEDKNGNVISRFTPSIEEAISEEDAYLMLNLLQGVVDEGTAGRLRWKYELYNTIAGKTGTTQNHSDGWFMGITPKLVTGVWTGGEYRFIHFDNISQGQGANMALPVFALYMQRIYNDPELGILEAEEFERPLNFDMELDCDKVNNNRRDPRPRFEF